MYSAYKLVNKCQQKFVNLPKISKTAKNCEFLTKICNSKHKLGLLKQNS